MSRKPKKGYYVRGQFVAEGSELDIELKAELKGTTAQSKTDLKRESTELQDLGEALLELRADLFQRLDLPEKLVEALAEMRRITNFEGRRRQSQFVGKLMRKLDDEQIDAVREALATQQKGSAKETLSLHEAEAWRDRLIADENGLTAWLAEHPDTDAQQLRSLVRQARKDAQALPKTHAGEAPRQGRAYREIFRLVRAVLSPSDKDEETPEPEHDD